MIMSAFVVKQTSINKIISWLRHEFLENSSLRLVARQFGVDVESEGWEQRLAEAMYALNIEAVNQRYSEKNSLPEIVYSLYPYTSRISAWKALRCWIYQCSEVSVPETNLYRYFAEIEKQTALHIVMGLPAYAHAEWHGC